MTNITEAMSFNQGTQSHSAATVQGVYCHASPQSEPEVESGGQAQSTGTVLGKYCYGSPLPSALFWCYLGPKRCGILCFSSLKPQGFLMA